MSADRQKRRAQARANKKTASKISDGLPVAAEPAVPRAEGWLILVFLLPNLWTLVGSFLFDDLPLIVQNERLHSLARLAEIWTHGYWPDRPGLPLYRPVTQTVWSILWTVGGGRPWIFHALNLVLGAAVVVLVYRVLEAMRVGARLAFIAALVFAVLPIHVEATAAVVGSNELLAAGFGLSALWLYGREAWLASLACFILAVFSKESAASVAVLALGRPFLQQGLRPDFRRRCGHGVVAAVVVAVAWWRRLGVAEGPVFIPPIDNAMSLVHTPQRILSALWVQVMYVGKSLCPLTLSADYSYKEIPLVMTLADARAWAGLALAALTGWAFLFRPTLRIGLAFWVVAFLPAANILMPIGTAMGERLAYLPSIGLAVLVAQAMRRVPRPEIFVAAIVLLFAARTIQRNRDWHDADAFYPKLAETSPGSAKVHYFVGCYLAARDNYPGALAAYDRAVEIFPAYPEALNNRGGALVQLGRIEEAKASYRACLRFDPGHSGAAASLQALEAGIIFVPQKPRI